MSIVSRSLVLIVVVSTLLSVVSGASYQLWSSSSSCSGSPSATGSASLSSGISGCVASSGATGVNYVRLSCTSSASTVQGFSDSACTAVVTQTNWAAGATTTNCTQAALPVSGSYSATLNCNSAFSLYSVSLPLMLLLSILVMMMI